MARRARSTAHFISYDLRPAKQTERRILLDLLKISGDCGLPISDYRYIGMGANRFYDFLLVHKYIGIRNMISLEHDSKMYKRAQFNCPYKFIEVLETNSSDFLSADEFEEPTIIWFDYDGGIGPEIVQDISDLGNKLKLNDFCFVTVFGGPPGVVDRCNDEERHEWVKDIFGPLAGDVDRDDVERANFPDAVHKVITTAFTQAFAARRDGNFFPFLQVEYADSLPMITVGGAFLANGQKTQMKQKIRSAMPFIMGNQPKFYEIKSLHLTEKERSVFDLVATKSDKRSAERNQIKRLGFKDAQISAYRDLLRYFPRYVETMV